MHVSIQTKIIVFRNMHADKQFKTLEKQHKKHISQDSGQLKKHIFSKNVQIETPIGAAHYTRKDTNLQNCH